MCIRDSDSANNRWYCYSVDRTKSSYNSVKEDYIMNINKFTQKSLQAVQDCEKIAMEYGNQEIEQEHLFYACLLYTS